MLERTKDLKALLMQLLSLASKVSLAAGTGVRVLETGCFSAF